MMTPFKHPKKAGRPKGVGRPFKAPVSLPQYRDAIEIMMTHGTNIDQIARNVQCSFAQLDAYLTEEGLYEKHKRRSWVKKTPQPKRKHKFADTKPRPKRGMMRDIPSD